MGAISPELSRERKTPKWYNPLHYTLLAAVVIGMLYSFWQLVRGIWSWIYSGFETTTAFTDSLVLVVVGTMVAFIMMASLEQWEAGRY